MVGSLNVNAISDESRSSRASTARYSAGGDWRLAALIDRLPQRVRGAVSYLLQPKSRWVRIPAGVLLLGGGGYAYRGRRRSPDRAAAGLAARLPGQRGA